MAAQDAIRLTWCTRENLPQVREMIGRHWRAGHVMARDAALYAWQFEDPGRPEGLSSLLVRRGDELVGHLGLIPGDFNLHGQRLPGRWASLWFVAKEVQAFGAGVALLRKAQDEAGPLLGCLRYNQIAGRLYQAMGFHLWPATPRWLRLGHQGALASLLADSPQPYAPGLCHDLAQAAGAEDLRPAPGLEVREWDASAPAPWQAAWEQDFAPALVSPWLDADFIAWRYVRHPVFAYRLRLARRKADGRVLGLMVYRVQELAGRGETILRLLELLCLPQAADALLADLLATAAALKPAFVDFHCLGQALREPLRRAGFVREDELPEMLPSLFQPLDYRREPLPGALWLRPGQGQVQEILDSPSLYLTRGQGDQDRPN